MSGKRWWRLLLGLAVLSAAAGAAAGDAGGDATAAAEAARGWRERNGARLLADFARLLEIPNVPGDSDGLTRTAIWLRDALAARGADATLVQRPGVPPAVLATLKTPGARRTLGVYLHYDGQPVDAKEWTFPPFRPTLTTAALRDGGAERAFPAAGEAIDPEWRIYGRGSGDDRAPAPALLGALDALREAALDRSADLVFFFEGEEEIGSTHLGALMDDARKTLDSVDLWLICDGPVHTTRRPQLVFGVRGYTQIEITLYGADRYLHSGHYGNWAPNPALRLARLLASMKDDAGKVTIEGFYDSVRPYGPAERDAIDALPDSDGALRREYGLHSTEGGERRLADAIMLPSFNIRGLESATVGDSARNVIPPTASASIDIRLVPDNDPEKMLDLVERHIAAQGYTIVRDTPDAAVRAANPRIARVERGAGYSAVRTPLDHPAARPIVEAARAVAGDELVLTPTLGGSLPLYLFSEKLGKPLMIVPIANHDDNQHAPDENLRIANLWYGIELFAALFTAP